MKSLFPANIRCLGREKGEVPSCWNRTAGRRVGKSVAEDVGVLSAGWRPAWEVTPSLRPEGREDTQRVLVGIGWHKGPAVETSQAYWGGTHSRGKLVLEREGGEADGGHLGMRARARDDRYSFCF